MTHPKRSLASMTTAIWDSRLCCRTVRKGLFAARYWPVKAN